MKLLIVEDEVLLSKSIAKGLRKLGYAVDCAFDGEEALELLEINTYDLMVLDINIPKINGLDVLKRIREAGSHLHVIILSAKNTVFDKVKGLDCGSNDYLTKPFDFLELEARIRNLLRQNTGFHDSVLRCGKMSIDTSAKKAYWDSALLDLTKKEYSILQYLLHHPDTVISAEDLIEHVWDSDIDLFSNSFRFHIHSLRKKIKEAGSTGEFITTVRGQGYMVSSCEEDSV
ncbi:response regulator transcription factor [Diplocloster agilis]|uniref:Stage 0 sporulation protein A homolog n=1 Tax=Diplocloster agilis TaxID=2850323 RepID=A0A949NE47_9FIRM|nr:response regulator transcription factor [Diplocloster agilis]MBU9745410.1 response regulator transcription factor [Diplocloster agilis]